MALAKRNYKKENKQPINKFIKAAKVRLISSSGEQMGIKSCLLYTSPSPRDDT